MNTHKIRKYMHFRKCNSVRFYSCIYFHVCGTCVCLYNLPINPRLTSNLCVFLPIIIFFISENLKSRGFLYYFS